MSLDTLIKTWRTKSQKTPKDCAADLSAYLASCDFRKAMPSPEQVRAHQARGGWWQARLDHDGVRMRRLVNLIVDEAGRIVMRDGINVAYFGTQFRPPWGTGDVEHDLANYEVRPCSADLWPHPWPDGAAEGGQVR